jgi:hypothetical protein
LALREATVHDGALRADYQGVLLGLAYAFGPALPLEASVVLPAYRIAIGSPDPDPGPDFGLGDLVLDARGALLSTERDHTEHRAQLQAGLELAASLPTARADTGLGMGHVMLMPGVFARVDDARAALLVQAGYGRALAAHGHAEHGGHVPDGEVHEAALASLVDPMSDSELEAALTLSVSMSARYALLGSLAAALPIATEGGHARAALGVGGMVTLAPIALSLRAELPLAGRAFTQRITLSATLAP